MADVASAVVPADHPCGHCGYNLRGLSRDGKCPECFTPITRSLRGDLLKFADPEWLDRLRFGTTLKLWNLLIGLAVVIAAVILVMSGFPRPLLALLAMVGGAMGLWASFVITTQEPRIAHHEDPVTWRKAIRICAVIGFFAEALKEIGQQGMIEKTLQIAGAVLSLAGLVAFLGELLYFRRFAARIPDTRLAHSTKIVMWGTAICLCLLTIVGIMVLVLAGAPGGGGGAVTATGGGPGAPNPAGAMFLVGFSCVAIVPAVVFLIWYVGLLFSYRKAFTAAAAESRQVSS